MEEYTREIAKEIFDNATQYRRIAEEDMEKVFTQAQLYGYGIYSTFVFEKDRKYFVRYEIGSTCD